MVELLVAGNHFVFAADTYNKKQLLVANTHNNKTAVSGRHTIIKQLLVKNINAK